MTPKRRNYGLLTDRQRHLLTVVNDLHCRLGMAPTLAEIADEMGVTKATTAYLVRMAKGKGYLSSLEGKYRSLRITESGMAAIFSAPEITEEGVTA